MHEILIYLILAATVLFQEEAAPLAGGLAAHHGHADLPLIVLVCAAGSWAGDLLLYALGRRSAGRVRQLPAGRALNWLRRHPRIAPLLIRFAYGARWSLPLAAGAAGVSVRNYVVWGGISALLWASIYAAIGWGAGALAMQLLSRARHYELPVIAVLMLVSIGFGARHLMLVRRAARATPAPAPGRSVDPIASTRDASQHSRRRPPASAPGVSAS